jgi:hypothetical protein
LICENTTEPVFDIGKLPESFWGNRFFRRQQYTKNAALLYRWIQSVGISVVQVPNIYAFYSTSNS